MSLMDFNDCGLVLARYNSWQNRVLFALCEQIGDDARKQSRDMFFGSIHATLNHILYIDQRTLSLLNGGPVGAFTPTIIIADDFTELRRLRVETDNAIDDFASSQNPAWQDKTRILHDIDGKTNNVPLQIFFLQMFNHQTHHRSQITAELYKMGLDYGVTGMPFTPNLPF